MGITRQDLTRDRLYIEVSDGRSVTVTKEQVQDYYKQTSGNAANRRQQTIDACKTHIRNALGAENVNTDHLFMEFDDTGGPDAIGWANSEWRHG